MFNSNKYMLDTIKLTNSYIIKMHSIAIRMNIELGKEGISKDDPYTDADLVRLGIRKYDNAIFNDSTGFAYSLQLDKDEMDPQAYENLIATGVSNLVTEKIYSRADDYELLGWKYYKNLMGEYHNGDYELLDKYQDEVIYKDGVRLVGIVFTSKDDGLDYVLTKETLTYHPITKQELLKGGEYYLDLINKYSKFEILIKGILRPVLDVNNLIHSKSGTILRYDDTLVSYNELNLIMDVGEELHRYLARWDVIEYTVVDDLYAASLFAGVTTAALMKTLNQRLSKVGTAEVSSFHLEEFFKSNFGVAEESAYLTKYSQIWLYKNLKYIIQNVGKEDVLMSIVDNVIDMSPLKISEVLVRLKKPDYTEMATRDILSLQSEPNGETLYKSEYRSNGKVFSDIGVEHVLIQELELVDRRHGDLGIFDFSKDEEALKHTNRDSERTKVMYLEYEAFVNTNVIDGTHVLLDNFFLFAFKQSSNIQSIAFKSTYTFSTVNITFRQAAILALKMILEIVGESDKPIQYYTTTTTVNRPSDIDLATSDLYLKSYVKEAANDILNVMPIFGSVSNKYDLEEYVRSIKLWFFYYNSIQSSVDVAESAKLDTLMHKIRTNYDVTISTEPKLIDDLMDEYNVEVSLGVNYDPEVVLEDLILTMTGLDLDPNKVNEDRILAYASLINKLTSYTTQVLHAEADDNTGDRFHTLNALYGIDVSYILTSSYKCLEDFIGTHTAYVDDDKDVVTYIGLSSMRFVLTKEELKQTMDLYVDDKVNGSIPELRYSFK